MAKKTKYSKEALIEKVEQGDNKALVLLLLSFSTGVFEKDRKSIEDKEWAIREKPLLSRTEEEYHHYLDLFKSRMKDMDEDELMSYYYKFAGTSINSFFMLEEMASRGIPEAYSDIADEYKEGSGMQGIFRDKAKALEFYHKAIEAGDPFAEGQLRAAEMDWLYEEQNEETVLSTIRVYGPEDAITLIQNDISVVEASFDGATPLSSLFKLFVGYGDYTGHLISVEKNGEELLIQVSTKSMGDSFALAFAIEQYNSAVKADFDYLRKQTE